MNIVSAMQHGKWLPQHNVYLNIEKYEHYDFYASTIHFLIKHISKCFFVSRENIHIEYHQSTSAKPHLFSYFYR